MYCPQCGQQNNDNANFCGSCGYSFQSDVQSLAKIVITRESKFVGSMQHHKVYLDNKFIGDLKNGNKLEIPVNYGEHSLVFQGAMKINKHNTRITVDVTKDNPVVELYAKFDVSGNFVINNESILEQPAFKGKENELLKQQIDALNLQNKALATKNEEMQRKFAELGIHEIEKAKATLEEINREIVNCNNIKSKLREEISSLNVNCEKEVKKLRTTTNKLNKSRELYKSIEYSIENFPMDMEISRLSVDEENALDELAPSVILKLHHMDVKDLRKAFRENEKQIEHLLALYSSRYTTKANQTIYQLMVIALRAELQNILYNLKFEKLDDAIEQVKDISQKYLVIAGNGNQSIVSTLTKFIGEIEYLFINAVKIEYNYYVKKEQARQEQLAIREQMRQEAEERRALELEKKKIENEEQKYSTEIERVKEQLANASQEEIEHLNSRILELQAQLSEVVLKKETISNLQNGKAGNVYIISNLGSFGDNVFKIGMTRRLDPQERVDELGSASVPFKFDVHSFIFSNDAVALEKNLHDALSNKRVNKVNMRKEFFYTSVDELEELVASIDETAEFNKTMVAEEFRQSLSTDEVYSSDFIFDDEE